MSRYLITFLISIFCVYAVPLFAEEGYYNPVDGKTYIADWEKYSPATKAAPAATRVVNNGVRLLNTQEEFNRNIGVQELAAFIKSIVATVEQVVAMKEDSGVLLIEAEILPKKSPTYRLAHQGNISQDTLQEIHDALNNLSETKSKESSIKLQVNLSIQKKRKVRDYLK